MLGAVLPQTPGSLVTAIPGKATGADKRKRPLTVAQPVGSATCAVDAAADSPPTALVRRSISSALVL
jgi:hypothetical protein